MQHQHGIMAVDLDGGDYGVAQGQPVARVHVGAVDQRQQLAKLPLRQLALRLLGLLRTHPRLEAGGRRQARFAHLHANGAAGVQQVEVVARQRGTRPDGLIDGPVAALGD